MNTLINLKFTKCIFYFAVKKLSGGPLNSTTDSCERKILKKQTSYASFKGLFFKL